MRVFVDTNVLVDLLDNSRECFIQSATIFEAAKEGYLDVCISSQSVTDCAYIARKKPQGIFKNAICRILPFVDVLPIKKEHLSMAVSSACPDFEDAAQIACAEDSLCEVIVTSNIAHFSPYTILTVLSPKEFVKKVTDVGR